MRRRPAGRPPRRTRWPRSRPCARSPRPGGSAPGSTRPGSRPSPTPRQPGPGRRRVPACPAPGTGPGSWSWRPRHGPRAPRPRTTAGRRSRTRRPPVPSLAPRASEPRPASVARPDHPLTGTHVAYPRAWIYTPRLPSRRRIPGRARNSLHDFRRTGAADPVARRLARAIQGKGAFRRFQDELHEEYPDLLPAWYAFREIRAKRRAVQWLADNPFIDDDVASRFLADHRDPDLS